MKRFVYLFLLTSNAPLICTQKITEVSRLSSTYVSRVIKPESISQLQKIIKQSKSPISFAGAKFSQGGQIAYPNGTVIDMTGLNKIVNLDIKNKIITVQPGIRWRDIQTYIDPHNLSIKVMQSYNDFTVGGSLSVNVHGRDTLGSLIKTVLSIKIITADGSIITATRDQNSDLFYAAIGGYGLLGPIVEVDVRLTDNIKIQRNIHSMPLEEYADFYFKNIADNPNIVFHSANLYPNKFNELLSISWHTTEQNVTISQHMQTHGLYAKEKIGEQLLRRVSFFKEIRKKLEKKQLLPADVVWRNYEMSYSTRSLEPIFRFPTTSILQEYFIPVHQLVPFVQKLKKIINHYNVNMLNIAIRHVPTDSESVLSYAPKDSFALVCYINVLRTKEQNTEREWTQELIDAALSVGGTFYLPYHLYATKSQFKKAYPNYDTFLKIKKTYDPHNKFTNSLFATYF